MKLHETPEGSKIKLELRNTETSEVKEDVVTFHHLDGMYSYCTTPDSSVIHLSASTPLVKDGEYYRIEKEQPIKENVL